MQNGEIIFTISPFYYFACFPHFLKTSSETPDFIEFHFQSGCRNTFFQKMTQLV